MILSRIVTNHMMTITVLLSPVESTFFRGCSKDSEQTNQCILGRDIIAEHQYSPEQSNNQSNYNYHHYLY
jgi:hypothetical protein